MAAPMDNRFSRNVPISSILTEDFKLEDGEYITAKVVWSSKCSGGMVNTGRRYLFILRDESGCVEAVLPLGDSPSSEATNIGRKLKEDVVVKFRGFVVNPISSFQPLIREQPWQILLSYVVSNYQKCEDPGLLPCLPIELVSFEELANTNDGLVDILGYAQSVEPRKAHNGTDFLKVRLMSQRKKKQEAAECFDICLFDEQYFKSLRVGVTYLMVNMELKISQREKRFLDITKSTIILKLGKRNVTKIPQSFQNQPFVKSLLRKEWLGSGRFPRTNLHRGKEKKLSNNVEERLLPLKDKTRTGNENIVPLCTATSKPLWRFETRIADGMKQAMNVLWGLLILLNQSPVINLVGHYATQLSIHMEIDYHLQFGKENHSGIYVLKSLLTEWILHKSSEATVGKLIIIFENVKLMEFAERLHSQIQNLSLSPSTR